MCSPCEEEQAICRNFEVVLQYQHIRMPLAERVLQHKAVIISQLGT